MIAESNRSLTNILLIALVLAVLSIACSRVQEIVTGPKESEKVRKLNSELPHGLKSSQPAYLKESSFVIVLPDSNEVLLNDADAQPVDIKVLGDRLAEYVATTESYNESVFIKASSNLSARRLVDVLNEIRKHDIKPVGLLVNGGQGSEKGYGREVTGRDGVVEVNIKADVYDRPSPFTLVAERNLSSPESIAINRQGFRNFEEMSSMLGEVFRQRESNGVFREGTNEVEKAVLLKIDEQSGTYGDIVQFVDALKNAGASPVVLVDDGNQWQIAKKSQEPLDSRTIRTQGPSSSKKLKTISGGVLNGKAISLPAPAYPPAARAVRAAGAVVVQITVDAEGNVVSANAVSGHPLLRPAAVQAARSARFSPTLLSGERVSVSGVLTYNFVP